MAIVTAHLHVARPVLQVCRNIAVVAPPALRAGQPRMCVRGPKSARPLNPSGHAAAGLAIKMEGGAIHCHVSNLTARDEDGQVRSAVAKAAYNCGQDLWIERQQRMTTLGTRTDVVHTEIFAPLDAPVWTCDRSQLWNTVELQARRKDARLAKNVQVAITRGIPPEQWPELLRAYVAPWVDAGHVVDCAIHEDGVSDNPHAHLMLTVNTLTATGFGPKLQGVDAKAFLTTARKRWAELTNVYLAKNGLPTVVSHRSYKDQGIPREPTKHRGPNRRERAAKRALQRAKARQRIEDRTMTKPDKDHKQTPSREEPAAYTDEIPLEPPAPVAVPWYEAALDNVRAEPPDVISDEDLRAQTGLTVQTQAERDLLIAVQDAPAAVQSIVESEIAHQQDQRQANAEQRARLAVLAERLSPEQQAKLDDLLEEQRQDQHDYPYPEPGPGGELYRPQDLAAARKRMQEDYEQEEQPER